MDSNKHDRITNMKLVYNILFINLIICLIFSVIYYVIKSEDNFNGLDEESTFIDCLYFSLTTASSVGYGDISPKSQLAKVFVMFQQICVIINLSHIAINWGTIETIEYHNPDNLNNYYKTDLISKIPNQPIVSSPVPMKSLNDNMNFMSSQYQQSQSQPQPQYQQPQSQY